MSTIRLFPRLSIAVRLLAPFAALMLWTSSAQAWWNHDWSYRKQIVLDAGAKGADLPADANGAVVLVRLHEGVLNFTDANVDGSDIRFVADDDKTPLKAHVEKFDPVFNLAFVWVQVPAIKNAESLKVWMYYGNPKAVTDGSPKDSYDANQLLVYHFGEKGKAPVDAGAFHQNASAIVPLDESGLIGNSARFDGATAIQIPASPNLNIAAGANWTWSAWVKPTAATTSSLFVQRDPSGAALVVGLNSGAPTVAVSAAGGATQTSTPAASIADNSWHHVAVVASPQITLYVDGKAVAQLAQTLPSINAAASLGGDAGATGAPVRAGFAGEIDELQISKIARSAAEIKLAASNQGVADKLVSFGGDEAQSGASTGYFSIILKSLTLDAWVVIVILVIMMIAAFAVMARKGRQIGKASKGSLAFVSIYEEQEGDLHAIHRVFAGPEESDDERLDLARHSPLMTIFNTGSKELQGRLRRGMKVLPSQTIDAIRAAMEGRLIRETQALNKNMVLLTIAISGGPFIGLLGTVMGVMITFASVAAAGDVNINAIAPGISAALAATVAGLGVAIPSLFGYNYLLTRAKECSVEMNVFVDEFITRIAENYNDEKALEAISE